MLRYLIGVSRRNENSGLAFGKAVQDADARQRTQVFLAFDSSCHKCAAINWPFAKQSRSNFSFGECALSSGKARPSSNVSTPRIFLKSFTMGMEPPSRIRIGSLPNAAFNARNAACACGPVGET